MLKSLLTRNFGATADTKPSVIIVWHSPATAEKVPMISRDKLSGIERPTSVTVTMVVVGFAFPHQRCLRVPMDLVTTITKNTTTISEVICHQKCWRTSSCIA